MILDPLRDPQTVEPVGVCPVCKSPVWPGDPAVKTERGIAHADCAEPEDPEDLALAKQMK